jgi:hypothetical protein
MAYTLFENTIEDILSSDIAILSELLDYNPSGLSLIARQKVLSSGKLDLLCMYDNALVLVELKVVPFHSQIISQVNGYCGELEALQRQNKLINAPRHKVILVTSCSAADIKQCEQEAIRVYTYKPEQVLSKYFENFRELSYFLTLQSGDYGVVRLGLLCSTLRLLEEGNNQSQISASEGKSIKTIKNRLSVATLLGLVTRYRGEYFLTEMGESFVKTRDPILTDRLSVEQSNILSDFVKEMPFYSQITYSILSLLETVLVLAKSAYPVDKKDTEHFFIKTVGKEQTWRTPKARSTATYIFSNYARELQFLEMIGDKFFITPKGVQAILLLQLNRSIKLIESQNKEPRIRF